MPPGRASARAALPPPQAVGTRAGRVAAGVEGPQDRRADHAPRPGGGGVRRRAGRDRRREEPDRAQPDRPHPQGTDQVRARQGPGPRGGRQGPPRRHLRLPRRRHPRLRHHVRHPGHGRRPRPRRHRRPMSPTSWAASATSHRWATAAPPPSGCSPTRNAPSTCSVNPTDGDSSRRTSRSPAPRSTSTSPATTSAATPSTARPPRPTSRSSAPPPSTSSRPGCSGSPASPSNQSST